MANRILELRNVATGKDYTVTGDGWDAIQKAGWASRYAIVRERVLSERARVTYLPDEVRAAVDGIQGVQKEDNIADTPQRRRRSQ